MLQLFSPHHVETIGFRLKNSALNAFVFDTIAPYDQGDPFLALIDAARGTRGLYTGLAPLTDDVSANSLSQAYFGPVAVLTNSGCFSTCDMFTAGMQDNALATIWGEDLRTGAGGANVWNYSFFGEWLPSDQQGPFLPLPGGQDMRVAWRDAIRAGLHQGQILEDYGVTADRNAGLTMNDVLNQDATQLATITRDLHRNAPSKVARVSFDDGGIAVINVSAGAAIAIPASVAGTSQVAFFLDGASIGVQSIAAAEGVTRCPRRDSPPKASGPTSSRSEARPQARRCGARSAASTSRRDSHGSGAPDVTSARRPSAALPPGLRRSRSLRGKCRARAPRP